MKRVALALLLLAIIAGIWLVSSPQVAQERQVNGQWSGMASSRSDAVQQPTQQEAIPARVSATDHAAPLIGDEILKDYADPAKSPANDLVLMAELTDNFQLLVKSAADRPLSANEEWSAALRGKNPAHQRFLSENQKALDSSGRLIDRWGTPLYFHSLGNGQFAIRSAGPDRKLWTNDDLQRDPNSAIRIGKSLAPTNPHNPELTGQP